MTSPSRCQRREGRGTALFLVVAVLVTAAAPATAAVTRPAAGTPLLEALRWLEGRGLDLVYSTAVVTPEMRLLKPPEGDTPREILEQVLAAHDLTVEHGAGDQLVVVQRPRSSGVIRGRVRTQSGDRALAGVEVQVAEPDMAAVTDADGRFEIGEVPSGSHAVTARLSGFLVEERVVGVEAGGTTDLEIWLTPLPVVRESIDVTPSRFSVLREDTSGGAALSRRDVDRLPHLTDDVYRVIAFLPGAAGGDMSAQLYVRGGDQDEILVLVDGLEIYEPFHFEDLASLFSVVDTEAIGGLAFLSGGFTAEYGDRMSGVIDIATASPEADRTSAGLSLINARLLNEGRFAGERGSWLVSGRRGYLDLVLDIVEQETNSSQLSPTYYDLLGKAQYQVSDRTLLALQVLGAYDDLELRDEDGERGEANASYGQTAGWLTLSTQWRPELSSRTLLSFGRVERDRRVSVDDLEGRTSCQVCSRRAARVSDERSFDFAGAKQEWSLSTGGRHRLKWGLDLRRLEASYDYSSYSAILDPLRTGRQEPVVTTRSLALQPAGDSYGAYLTDRIDLAPSLVLELGLRWDRQSWVPDEQLSPRFNLVYLLGDHTAIRAAWGRFHQSQGIHELQVAEGVSTFFPAQLAEHRLIGLESRFARVYTLRVEAYQKQLSHPRVRFENLHDPLNLIPEASADRIEIAPRRATTSGFEALVERHDAGRWGWKLSYALATTEDEVDGRWIPRSWDQRHTLRFSVNRELGQRWNLNLAGTYHSGWPTTPVTVRFEEGPSGSVLVPELGARNSDRLPWFERLDARLARQVTLPAGGSLTVFFEVMNLLNHRNLRGFSGFELDPQDDGTVRVDPDEETWLPRIPSFGLTWSF